jgi:hypothetical protein
VNLTDPAHPARATGYNTPGDANSVRVLGNYVFVADGTNGLVILEAQPLQRPKLTIARSETNALLRWPASALGFVPESKPDLNSRIWSAVPETPRFTDDVFSISVSMPTNQFYRLRRN